MTRKPITISYAHAGDLSTKQANALEWCEGCSGSRYQEIAIVDGRVIGSWEYSVEWHRGEVRIESSHTGVATRYRRRGIAKALWLRGIARWQPTRIAATIGTDEGRDFLARMTARIAYVSPSTLLWVTKRKEDEDSWAWRCESEALELLKALGRERAANTAKKLTTPKQPLALVEGGAS